MSMTLADLINEAQKRSEPPAMGWAHCDTSGWSVAWSRSLPDGTLIQANGFGTTAEAALADASANESGTLTDAKMNEVVEASGLV